MRRAHYHLDLKDNYHALTASGLSLGLFSDISTSSGPLTSMTPNVDSLIYSPVAISGCSLRPDQAGNNSWHLEQNPQQLTPWSKAGCITQTCSQAEHPFVLNNSNPIHEISTSSFMENSWSASWGMMRKGKCLPFFCTVTKYQFLKLSSLPTSQILKRNAPKFSNHLAAGESREKVEERLKISQDIKRKKNPWPKDPVVSVLSIRSIILGHVTAASVFSSIKWRK